jgi:glycerol-1-phosphate dehydrogenase [NAD(P)+]
MLEKFHLCAQTGAVPMNIWPLPRITFRQLSTVREDRPTALITEASAWSNIKSQIDLPLAIQAEPNRVDRGFLESLGQSLPSQIEVIYAIGDDAVIDAAKMIAYVGKRPLVIIPTSFSSDVPFTWTASVRGDKGMEDVDTGAAEEVIINWTTITDANANERGAGIVEVLSSVPALMDWRLAAQKNQTTPETRLSTWAMQVAAALSMQATKLAPQIGQGSAEALRGLLDLMCMSIQMDSVLGHRRASRGTEHWFADVVKAEPHVTHAEKVAAGILFALALHGQDVTQFKTALEQAGLRLNQIAGAEARTAATKLPQYVKDRGLPYSILNEVDSNAISKALEKSTLLGSGN